MSKDFVTVAVFDNPIEANLAKNRLEEARIRAFILNESLTSTMWHLTNAFGGIKVQVAEMDADKAIALLEQDESIDPQAGSPEEAFPDDEGPDVEPPQAVGDSDSEEADEPEPGLNQREQDADRAFKAAVLGLLLFPLQFYAFWLVLKVFLSNEPLSNKHFWSAMIAALIATPMTMLVGAIFLNVGLMVFADPSFSRF